MSELDTVVTKALGIAVLMLTVVSTLQQWALQRIKSVLRHDREQLRAAWHALRAERRENEELRKFEPGYDVVQTWCHGKRLIRIYDRRDQSHGREPIAVVTTDDAVRAALRLLGGGR